MRIPVCRRRQVFTCRRASLALSKRAQKRTAMAFFRAAWTSLIATSRAIAFAVRSLSPVSMTTLRMPGESPGGESPGRQNLSRGIGPNESIPGGNSRGAGEPPQSERELLAIAAAVEQCREHSLARAVVTYASTHNIDSVTGKRLPGSAGERRGCGSERLSCAHRQSTVVPRACSGGGPLRGSSLQFAIRRQDRSRHRKRKRGMGHHRGSRSGSAQCPRRCDRADPNR